MKNDRESPPSPRIEPLKLLESSEDPDARKVANVYQSVPASYRRLLPPEAYCLAAGISPWRVLEMITVIAVRQEVQASTIVASVLSVRVLQKIIQRALRDDGDDGFRERLMLSKATGFLR